MSGAGATGLLVAVCTVHEVRADPSPVGRTGIDKRPVDGPVEVTVHGLQGDVVVDTEHHGGRDQAVYAYAREDAERWADELGAPVGPGAFGENLSTTGLVVSDAVVGQRWHVGGEVVLEVTLPRIPCATFGRWLQQPRWGRRFTARADTGAYLRVVAPGTVRAGDLVVPGPPPEHGVTVRELFVGTDAAAMARLLEHGEDVPPKAVRTARQVLDRG